MREGREGRGEREDGRRERKRGKGERERDAIGPEDSTRSIWESTVSAWNTAQPRISEMNRRAGMPWHLAGLPLGDTSGSGACDRALTRVAEAQQSVRRATTYSGLDLFLRSR